MNIFHAVVGRPVEIPVLFGSVSGLTLDTLDVLYARDGAEEIDIEDDLEATLEPLSGITGIYLLVLRPRRAGTLFLRMVEGVLTNEFAVQSVMPDISSVNDPSLEGDHLIVVKVGTTRIPGATVRVYDSAGTSLVARGLTDADGEISFALEAGTYQVRVNKQGVDFGNLNPFSILVVPNNSQAPRLDEVLPIPASIGDMVTLFGQFFDGEDTEVLFGTLSPVPALYVNATRRALLVTVPTGLTSTAVSVRVRKPDADSPGSYLVSNVVTMERVS